MTGRIAYWAVTVALAGFLFGFDTAVISGADQPIQALWQTGDLFHGLFIMSAALWGTVIGALGGNWPCERWGRKKVLIGIGVLYLTSAVGSAVTYVRAPGTALHAFNTVTMKSRASGDRPGSSMG